MVVNAVAVVNVVVKAWSCRVTVVVVRRGREAVVVVEGRRS